jgi:hypothetical protein
VNRKGFGYFPAVEDGKLTMKNATPLQYLERLDGTEEAFGVKTRMHGVTLREDGRPAFVTSQPNIHGSVPDWDVVEQKLGADGYRKLSDDYSIYYRPADNTLLFDAHPENFRFDGKKLIGFDVGAMHPEGELRTVVERQYAEAPEKSGPK